MRSTISRALLFAIFNVVVVGVLFLLIEGAASTWSVGSELLRSRPVAERLHTTFDEQLGWINRPTLFIKDMYGPGIYLRTNAQRFRSNVAFSLQVPAGLTRVVCSGDSFTFGYGVDNDHTWCQQLAGLDARLQPVNMGQGGYGLDQIYLWYKRDAAVLQHQLHVLAVVTVDFDRMLLPSFLGYGKPLLDLDAGQLAVRNVPLQAPSAIRLWLNRSAPTLQKLHSVQALRSWMAAPTPTEAERRAQEERFRRIVALILDNLQQQHEREDVRLLVAYLPTRLDYQNDTSDFWREFLKAETARRALHYVDLIEAMRQLPPTEIASLFIPEGPLAYVGAAGHYTEKGNSWVAERIYRELAPLIAAPPTE